MPGENPAELIAKNIFVQVQSSSKTIFTGEPVLVTYKLFTALNSQSRVTMQPSFSGCSVQELPIDKEPEEAILDGKKYHVFTIRKVQLIPLQAGELILGKALVENVVAIADSGNLLETKNYSAITGSDTKTLTVRALPENGKPPNFQILAGNYSIAATIEKDTFQVGENATLVVKISGSGNIQGIPSPVILWPENIEHFDGIDTQQADQYVFPVQGYKQFEIPFIGKKIGASVLPPISFSFFDPLTSTYKNIHTDSIQLYFTKATPAAAVAVDANISQNNLKYLFLIPLIALIVFLSVYIPGLLRRKRTQKKETKPAPDLHEEKKVTMVTTGDVYIHLHNLTTIQNIREYFLSVKSLLVLALQIKTGIGETVESALVHKLESIPGEMDNAKKSQQIFDKCNFQLFAQNEFLEMREEVYFELSALLKNLDLKESVNP